ncbi:MAG: hypothetical protein IGS48_11320 [Oscillatoriales cyanobacterium C42_A2020_001]|nr:hypothetical protein [Leptolyngbyaceae cyanobacterium C42_A2020_001]
MKTNGMSPDLLHRGENRPMPFLGNQEIGVTATIKTVKSLKGATEA